MKLALVSLSWAAALYIPSAAAWGVVGHEAVATIAQIHLHDSARSAIAKVLPAYTKGHMAPVAAWADRVRYVYHWSGILHYITPNGDHPNDTCIFDQGFKNEENNVVKAISNYTQRLAESPDDIDLRFLIHYIGDVHQPLHLTGRERGGNGDHITFDGRKMSLHGLWDTQLLARAVRELHNYTAPTSSKQIESSLRGTIYDGFIRWILLEGVSQWWRDDVPSWLECPSTPSTTTLSFNTQHQQILLSEGKSSAKAAALEEILICPEHWASEVHEQITCTYVCAALFPSSLQHFLNTTSITAIPRWLLTHIPPPELGGKEYYGRIRNDKVFEGLLAKGGLRLAAVLNAIFASEEDLATRGLVDFSWIGAEAGIERASKGWMGRWW